MVKEGHMCSASALPVEVSDCGRRPQNQKPELPVGAGAEDFAHWQQAAADGDAATEQPCRALVPAQLPAARGLWWPQEVSYSVLGHDHNVAHASVACQKVPNLLAFFFFLNAVAVRTAVKILEHEFASVLFFHYVANVFLNLLFICLAHSFESWFDINTLGEAENVVVAEHEQNVLSMLHQVGTACDSPWPPKCSIKLGALRVWVLAKGADEFEYLFFQF